MKKSVKTQLEKLTRQVDAIAAEINAPPHLQFGIGPDGNPAVQPKGSVA